MKKTFSSKKSAFSLIELSIVLIIIGLLIAGVTGGASLIKSSELRSAISEARGYAVAVKGFYSQYNELPGDYEVQISGTTGKAGATNGTNSRIEYYASDATYTSESVVAWEQLIATGTIDSTLNLSYSATTNKQLIGTNMPSSKIKFAGWHFDYRNSVGSDGAVLSGGTSYGGAGTKEGSLQAPANQNVVVLTVATQAASNSTSTLVNGALNVAYTLNGFGALNGSDALSIDTKIDDSFANAGKVRGLNPGNSTECYTTSTSADQAYNVSNKTKKVCNLTFQVDVNS